MPERAVSSTLILTVICLILVPSLSYAQVGQWGFGPRAYQPMLRDPELNAKAAGLAEPQRDVPLRGIAGISWGTDVRFLNGLKHVGDVAMLGGIAQYVLEKPLTHVEKIPVDKVLFGFWNGMFCNTLIDIKDLPRYLAFKDHFTKLFGPPFVEKNGDTEKCSWKAKYAIILMRYDRPKGRITIWSDEVYQKMVAAQALSQKQSETR